RKSKMAVYVGAVPGAIPPLLGQMAISGRVELPALALAIILFIWQLPHFLAISLFYSRDYANANIKIYPNVSGFKLTKIYIILFTILLFLASLLPAYWNVAGVAYIRSAVVLSGSFLLLALMGLGRKPAWGFFFKDGSSWVRGYYWGSLIYLPLLFLAVIFFK
ncbi:MAG: UbiA family prenyltransferase, partial [Halobacteriovoraceae bacterium]|nr:UbiA family prenyltransferase [Halobacteriovoraceae bacterium]